MKRHFDSCQRALAAGLAAALLAGLSWSAPAASSADKAASDVPIRSVFVIPNNPSEGCDPFFPTSSRPYASAQVVQVVPTADISSLVLKGVSGPANARLAIINNRTFAVGDEQDIITATGRIRVRCVEINDTAVVVESAGERHELKYIANP